MINIGIYDEHHLMGQGLKLLLERVPEFEILFCADHKDQLMTLAQNRSLNILILSIHDTSVRTMNLIIRLSLLNPKARLLILSFDSSEETIVKIVKSKAKGILGHDASQKELIEAICTLRNGFDYFNRSINQMVLNQYIDKLDVPEEQTEGLNSLSERQIEVLKLWGRSYSNQEIADELCISVRTVDAHKNHIMQKLQLKSTVELVKFSIKNNIIEI
ncbi:LuxR C-terminal-related transcriptional regulator [Sunxiuqinia sp. sy24]|uniref:LuxR C-terminal-related transcriptional regulator n=1 Tax=Sunxiuqinia sp. sy24 TaxID=3461495 RepID=UPI0040451A57